MFVRLALESDAEALRVLGRAHAQETTPQDKWDNGRATATFQRYLDGGNPTFFVCEDDREVVGYVVGLLVDKPFTSGFLAYMSVLYVRPDKRGTRAAAELIETFNQWTDRLRPSEAIADLAGDGIPPLLGRYMQRLKYQPSGVVLSRVPS